MQRRLASIIYLAYTGRHTGGVEVLTAAAARGRTAPSRTWGRSRRTRPHTARPACRSRTESQGRRRRRHSCGSGGHTGSARSGQVKSHQVRSGQVQRWFGSCWCGTRHSSERQTIDRPTGYAVEFSTASLRCGVV